jgi:hypothetical protein
MCHLLGIVLSFVGAVLIALWGFSFRVENNHLAFNPDRAKVLMPLGTVGFVLFSLGFLLQLIHECCLLA